MAPAVVVFREVGGEVVWRAVGGVGVVRRRRRRRGTQERLLLQRSVRKPRCCPLGIETSEMPGQQQPKNKLAAPGRAGPCGRRRSAQLHNSGIKTRRA